MHPPKSMVWPWCLIKANSSSGNVSGMSFCVSGSIITSRGLAGAGDGSVKSVIFRLLCWLQPSCVLVIRSTVDVGIDSSVMPVIVCVLKCVRIEVSGMPLGLSMAVECE